MNWQKIIMDWRTYSNEMSQMSGATTGGGKHRTLHFCCYRPKCMVRRLPPPVAPCTDRLANDFVGIDGIGVAPATLSSFIARFLECVVLA
jgi:hypothetical protein